MLSKRVLGIVSSVVVMLAGCGGSGSGPSGSGTLSLRMSDAPTAALSELDVHITRAEANVDGTWQEVPLQNSSFNLLDLRSSDALLGSVDLPAGHYTQVRLFLDSMTAVTPTGGQEVQVGSVAQTGIKLNLDYDISANEVTTILMDFNVAKSLVQQGNGVLRLQPVIPVVVKVLSGTITGVVKDSTGSPVAGAAITATYTAGSAYPLGTDVNTSVSATDGTFKVWALLPGTYTVTATSATDNTKTVSLTGVVVTANQNTAVPDLSLP